MNFGCPIESSVAGQISLLRGAQKAPAAICCTVAFEQAGQFQFLPQGRADQLKETGETVRPLTEAVAETKAYWRFACVGVELSCPTLWQGPNPQATIVYPSTLNGIPV